MRQTTGGLGVLMMVAALAGCSDDTQHDLTTTDRSEPTAVAAETGSIAGRVTLAGDAPTLEPFTISVNGDVCGAAATSNLLTLGSDNGIVGAIVYVELSATQGEPGATQIMDQSGCQYKPHIVAATPGTTIGFRNSDPTPHNVRVESVETGRILLNVAQGAQGKVDEWKIPEPGVYFVGCDYHPWMNGYVVGVHGGRFAVTDANGNYRIDGVPVGEQTLKLWHNSVDIREKRDTEGRLIGYRFDDPITKSSTVTVSKDSAAKLDIAIEIPTANRTASK